MALGTVTPVAVDPHCPTIPVPVVTGDLRMMVTNVVGEASYTTGGPVITATQLGFPSTIVVGQAEILSSTGSNATSAFLSVVVQPGGGSAKLQAWTSANAEITGAVNVSGVTWQIIAFGY